MDKIKKFFLNRARDVSVMFPSSKPPVTLLSFKKLQEVPLCDANDNKIKNIKNSSIPTRLHQSSVTLDEVDVADIVSSSNQNDEMESKRQHDRNNDKSHCDIVPWQNLMSTGINNNRLSHDSSVKEYAKYALYMKKRGQTYRRLEDIKRLSNLAAFQSCSSVGSKIFPIIVRANGITVKCLGLGLNLCRENRPTFSQKLTNRLQLNSTSEITISSWDDRQNFNYTQPQIRTPTAMDWVDPVSAFYYNWLIRLYWSHLFGPGDLQENDDVVMVETSKEMTEALEFTALTVMKAPDTRRWESFDWVPVDKPLLPEDRRTPEAASYWLLDEQNYYLASINTKMRMEIISRLNKVIEKREKLLEETTNY